MQLTKAFLFFSAIIFLSACNLNKKATKQNKAEKEAFIFSSIYLDANQQKILGNYDYAAELFLKCLKLNPKSGAANYEMANVLFLQRKLPEAAEYAKKAYQIDPYNFWYGKLYAEITKQGVMIDEHIKHLEDFAKHFPDKPSIKIDLAIANSMARRPEMAIKIYDQVENQIGVSEEISVEKHKLYLDLGKYEDAENELIKLVESQPNNVIYMRKLAEFYMKSGNFEKVKEINEKILVFDPNDPYTHLGLYDYYTQKGEIEKGFEHLYICFENPDMSIDVKVKMLVSFYSSSGVNSPLHDKVYRLLELLNEAHPNEAKTHSVYADFLYRDDEFEKAQEQFKKAVELEKGKYILWRQLIIVSSELKDFQSMYDYSHEAIEYFPTQSELYWYKGIAALQLKNYEEAITSFKGGRRYVVDNDDMKARFSASLGDAYHGAGKHDKSDEAYEESLKIMPNDAFVLNNYAYYLSLRKKNLNRAEEMSKKSLEIDPNNVNFLDTYGWILFLQEDYQGSLSYMEKAYQNGGEKSGTILEHLGDVHYHLKDAAKAIEFWKRAAELNDGSDALQQKIAEGRYIETIEQ